MKRISIISFAVVFGILGAAYAASKQSVTSAGTKVAAAGENSLIRPECQEKYDGCMDSLCMTDNESGGRCVCSDKYAEYDALLSEIDKLDEQSFQMATVGADMIESGAEITEQAAEQVKKSGADLSLWDDEEEEEEEYVEDDDAPKKGDALRAQTHEMCVERMPECADQITMLTMMYSTKIRSDCAGYKNALEKRRDESDQKLATAEKALRDAALDKYTDANKYDLGQCTVEFKKCMQTTAECGSDFALCAEIPTDGAEKYSIKGAASQIDISMGTYNRLDAKKIICDHVTKQCDAVAGQVWDTFLREIAPTLQTAELIADDAQRQNCAESVSKCFQTACKDNIDPNDPDGSYDMCLTRPASMMSFCKVELNKCGVDTTDEETAQKSGIWDYVVARLAAMRVNACTEEVKACLTDENRCGSDYGQCVGLDTNTIIKMCPYEKMTGCQKVYGAENITGDAVYDELSALVQGLFVNVDNALLKTCQNAVDAAMMRVCGDTENCNNMAAEPDMGAGSLQYGICEYWMTEESLNIEFAKCRNSVDQIADTELGRIEGNTTPGAVGPMTPLIGALDGVIYWNMINFDAKTGNITTVDEYLNHPEFAALTSGARQRVADEINKVQRGISSTINTIESDPKVQWCMSGRKVDGWEDTEFADQTPRFPNITQMARNTIAMHALKAAKDNYLNKYDELNTRMLQDRIKIGERMAEIRGENAKDVRREAARMSCKNLPEMSAMPKSEKPTKLSTIFAGIAIAIALIVATVFTAGAALGAAAGVAGGLALGLTAATTTTTLSVSFTVTATSIAATVTTVTTTTIGLSAAGIAATAIGATAVAGAAAATAVSASGGKDVDGEIDDSDPMIGEYKLKQWNYEEDITTVFNPDTFECEKCTVSRNCEKVNGERECKKWSPDSEKCETIQF